MDSNQTLEMARHAEVTLSADEAAELVLQCRGWPVALYLAMRPLRERNGDRPRSSPQSYSSLINDYIRSELFEPLGPKTSSGSPAPRSSASCPDRSATPRSRPQVHWRGFERFERSNLLLHPLDDDRTTYRHHPLLRAMLRDELDVRQPDAAAAVSVRAAAWWEAQGDIERAVDYARESRDMAALARLVARHALPMFWAGRTSTVERWLGWFDQDSTRERWASIAVLAGMANAIGGRLYEAERWLATAERAQDAEPMPDGTVGKEPWVALLRGMMAPRVVPALQQDARVAFEGLPEDSPLMPAARTLDAIGQHLAGSMGEAADRAKKAAEIAEARGAVPALAMAVGAHSSVLLATGDWQRAAEITRLGLARVERAAHEEFAWSALLNAVAAQNRSCPRLDIGREPIPGTRQSTASRADRRDALVCDPGAARNDARPDHVEGRTVGQVSHAGGGRNPAMEAEPRYAGEGDRGGAAEPRSDPRVEDGAVDADDCGPVGRGKDASGARAAAGSCNCCRTPATAHTSHTSSWRWISTSCRSPMTSRAVRDQSAAPEHPRLPVGVRRRASHAVPGARLEAGVSRLTAAARSAEHRRGLVAVPALSPLVNDGEAECQGERGREGRKDGVRHRVGAFW